MPIWWLLGVLVIVGIIVASAVWASVQQSRNDSKPLISEEARVVKITDRNSGMFVRGGTRYFLNTRKEYYVTFESLSNGAQRKFFVPVNGHKIIAEGDVGVLTSQGTRYISFKRQ